MLVRLLYASRVSDGNMCDIVQSIMQQSRQHNPPHGITGVLCHTDAVFMQVLEGGRKAVNTLYSHILRDPRHTDVILLDYEEIGERRYAGWTMGQANMNKINPSILLKYSPLPELNPHEMPGKTLLSLIDELMATASIVGRT
ncbi:BLUF domain-containing protein [Undibacterium oligocarboniphilum]|uniref:BLUF domain-containing protein n=1 Tax=Undibacterium oligocarboniphilum TaxID=666702 RepID=A0A850Q882_9BURK|nr:BLUF domain-containing protein [Undibacterium oligocarboniphilum]MBC3870925.1 BLUF domain-containing protein [Undibacterium oligocarboniphilum]NVO76452.1 BLUF domain-containing protein [Undibacterium oligocarboniphilum]